MVARIASSLAAAVLMPAACDQGAKPTRNQSLSDMEIRQYIKYFQWIDAQPPGSVKASSGGH